MAWIRRRSWFWLIDGCNVEGHIIPKRGRASLVNWGSSLSGDIELGEGVIIGINVTITASVHGFKKGIYIRDQKTIQKKIIIGDDVFIGSGATILAGNIIKNGAIIGAGSVLTEDNIVGENEIWAGNPAKLIKLRG